MAGTLLYLIKKQASANLPLRLPPELGAAERAGRMSVPPSAAVCMDREFTLFFFLAAVAGETSEGKEQYFTLSLLSLSLSACVVCVCERECVWGGWGWGWLGWRGRGRGWPMAWSDLNSCCKYCFISHLVLIYLCLKSLLGVYVSNSNSVCVFKELTRVIACVIVREIVPLLKDVICARTHTHIHVLSRTHT